MKHLFLVLSLICGAVAGVNPAMAEESISVRVYQNQHQEAVGQLAALRSYQLRTRALVNTLTPAQVPAFAKQQMLVVQRFLTMGAHHDAALVLVSVDNLLKKHGLPRSVAGVSPQQWQKMENTAVLP